MFSLLKQPYPFETEVIKTLRSNLVLGVFVFFFLLIFQPFQLNHWETNHKIWKISGYGAVTFFIPTLFFLVLNLFFSLEKLEKTWNVGKEIMFLLLYILGIALGNTIYSAFLGIVDISTEVFLGFVPIVLCIGVFPVSARVLIYHQWYKEINKKEAKVLESEMKVFNDDEKLQSDLKTDEITFIAENEKDRITVLAENILYIESLDNYSKIVYIHEKKICNTVLRGSLKRFEYQILPTYIQRCHRSFIANLHKVSHVTGNAQGYKLIFEEEKLEIPVSRNYGQIILSFIGSKKR